MNEQERSALRVLVDARQSIQKSRIQFGNRIDAAERGKDETTSEAMDIFKRSKERLEQIESDLNDGIRDLVKDNPIFDLATQVKGVGDVSLSQILVYIDINKTPTVSSLWKLAGYGVTNGVGDRLRKGEKAAFYVQLKGACARMGISLLKCRSPYADYYHEMIQYYLDKGWEEKHSKIAARRRMMKLFLQHLWITWRELEGLPTNQPYAMDILKHGHYISPQQYGWPASTK